MKKYTDALRYLDTFVNYEKKGFSGLSAGFDLSRVMSCLKKLGHPERSYRSIHVAGTKGKGSVAAFSASILRASSMKTGLYTSPHLSSPVERIAYNGKNISRSEFAEGINFLSGALGPDINKRLTYFEFFTVLAMWFFAAEKVDVAVFETGMGGRLDATNVIVPEVCVITSISRDHTKVLGNSLEKIAREKAAIIKKGAVCVSARQKRAPLRVIKEVCQTADVPLVLMGRDIKCGEERVFEEGSVFDLVTPGGRYEDCRTTMPGEFQIENAAVAAAVCEIFWKRSRLGEIDPRAMREGIKKAFLPGRVEVLARNPLLVIDGAHNVSSIERLAETVKKVFDYDKLILITGFCDDKEIKKACSVLARLADSVIVTRAGTPRSASPEKVARFFQGKNPVVSGDVTEALKRAFSDAGKKDMILAAGSLYLAGEVRQIMKRK